MKVQESDFIRRETPLLKELLEKLLAAYPYASILAVDSKARRYSVSKRNMAAGEDDLLTSRGFVAKVWDGKHYAEYSFNKVVPEELEEICARIGELVAASDRLLPEGLEEKEYLLPEEERRVEKKTSEEKRTGEKTVFEGSTEYEVDPEEMGDDAILKFLEGLKDKGLAMNDALLNLSAFCEYQKYTKLFLSGRKELLQNVMWFNGGISLAASRGEEIKSYFKSYSCLGGAELLPRMEEDLEESVAATVELLESRPIPPGEYTCICAPDVTGMIVHEAFGHGVEMDMFVKKRAQAQEFLGKYVASPLVTMHDGAGAVRETATYFFDDEGTLAHDTVIIDKGVLKTGISDLQSALSLGTEPTGNGRRESYRRKAYTRMTNTYFEAGDSTREEMIASVDYGFLLENAESGMEDPKNWGIQCMVNIAREIKDGKLTGKVFSPIVLTGYVPDLLKSISMMGKDVELGGGGFCGKGYKEWVKVSDGGPYIKARIRLG